MAHFRVVDGPSHISVMAARSLNAEWTTKGVGASVEEAMNVINVVNLEGL